MIGPSVGPSTSSLPINPSLPANPTTLPPPAFDPTGVYSAGATVFAAPQPLPPPHPSLPAMPAFSMAPPGIHPSRLAAMGMPSPVAGVVRSAEEMGGDGAQQAAAKRPRVEKLPEGRYYTETDWVNLHNVSITLNSIAVTIISFTDRSRKYRTSRCLSIFSCRRIQNIPSGRWTARWCRCLTCRSRC